MRQIVIITSILINITLGTLVLRNYILKKSDRVEKFLYARSEIYANLPVTKSDVVFIGDSILEGFPVSEFFKSISIKNRAISNSQSKHLLPRIDRIAHSRPRKIIIMIGVNDIIKGVPLRKIQDNIVQLTNSIYRVSPTTNVYLLTVLPTSGKYVAKNKSILELNTTLYNTHFVKNVKYLNIYPAFVLDKSMNPIYTYDGLHLTYAGYQKLYSILKNEISLGV